MLNDIRIIDLSRILAGPWATQVLGDLGADVIKVERPGSGDDTRHWGPPFMAGGDAAYFGAANRNKRSIAVDLAHPEGQQIVQQLCAGADVVVENFRVGGAARFGLDYASLATLNPALVYCSITGFGQTGPEARRPGYDAMIQAMGGLMSITGEADGPPQKVGVAVSDLMTGMYGATAILAALHERRQTGRGRHLDLALFDCQLAGLANQAMNWFVGGQVPGRLGSAHPNIVPYQPFACADGHLMLAVGNDRQFARWCTVAGVPELADDDRFVTNRQRVAHRELLTQRMEPLMAAHSRAHWQQVLDEVGVPCGPINTIDEAFGTAQAQVRGMVNELPAAGGQSLRAPSDPILRRPGGRAPPALGQHTNEVLEEIGVDGAQLARLVESGVVGQCDLDQDHRLHAGEGEL